MIDHSAYRLACRTRAKTLSIAVTGSIAMSATATGYARTTGSFLTDGFKPGMELSATGFTKAANNGAKMVTAVTALALSVPGLTVEAALAGRTLSVGYPSARSYENVDFKPQPGQTFVDEQYMPGASKQTTLGALGQLEITPMYSIGLNVPRGLGESAAEAYQKGFLTLFAPRTAIALASGDVLRVRTDTGPYPGQLLPVEQGFSRMAITIPLWVWTNNSI